MVELVKVELVKVELVKMENPEEFLLLIKTVLASAISARNEIRAVKTHQRDQKNIAEKTEDLKLLLSQIQLANSLYRILEIINAHHDGAALTPQADCRVEGSLQFKHAHKKGRMHEMLKFIGWLISNDERYKSDAFEIYKTERLNHLPSQAQPNQFVFALELTYYLWKAAESVALKDKFSAAVKNPSQINGALKRSDFFNKQADLTGNSKSGLESEIDTFFANQIGTSRDKIIDNCFQGNDAISLSMAARGFVERHNDLEFSKMLALILKNYCAPVKVADPASNVRKPQKNWGTSTIYSSGPKNNGSQPTSSPIPITPSTLQNESGAYYDHPITDDNVDNKKNQGPNHALYFVTNTSTNTLDLDSSDILNVPTNSPTSSMLLGFSSKK